MTLTALRKISSDEVAKLQDAMMQDAEPDTTIIIIPWGREQIATRDDIFRICKTRHPLLGDRKTRFDEFLIDDLLQHADGVPHILVARQEIRPDARTYQHENEELHLTRLASGAVVQAWNGLVARRHDGAEYDHVGWSAEELVPNPDQPYDFFEDNLASLVLLLSRVNPAEQRQIRDALDELRDFERGDASVRRTTYLQFATDKDVTVRELVHFLDGEPPHPSTSTPRFSTRPGPFIAIDRAFLTTHKALVFASAYVWHASTGEE